MRYVTKEFLTPDPYESGFVINEITTDRYKDIQDYDVRNGGQINGELKIGDCFGKIALDFNATGQKQFDKRILKWDNLIEQLTKARHQYQAMWENHQRDLLFYQQEKEREKKAK